LKAQGPTYAAPFDRDNLDRGAFLVTLRGVPAKNSPRNRQRVFDQLMEQFEEGAAPFDDQNCFLHGLSEQDLIYIPFPTEDEMSKQQPSPESPEQADILLAATELLELAKLKVALASAYREAQQYKELVFKVIDTEGGHLSEEECEIVTQKNFAKNIRALAEARVKVSHWAENSSGNHELILNELSFMDEEIVTALSSAKSKAGKAEREEQVA
jgi:hypothetical protein